MEGDEKVADVSILPAVSVAKAAERRGTKRKIEARREECRKERECLCTCCV